MTGPSDVCTSPASAGTATTFKVGIANSFSVTCYGTGFGSASAGNYPSAITVNTGALPADATFQLSWPGVTGRTALAVALPAPRP